MSRKNARHEVSGRWRLGFFLAATAMATWAALPISLTLGLEYVDAWTLTWFRFSIAAIFVGGWLGRRGSIRWRALGGTNRWPLLLVAAVALTANYMFYILGLERTTPALSQVVIQLAPVLLGLGGIWVFGERYSRLQWTGFAVLVTGLGVFFHDQLRAFAEVSTSLWIGSGLVVAGALAWAVYALAQKQLLTDYSSGAVMLFIYLFAVVVLLPATRPASLAGLSFLAWVIVASCGLNTLVGYSAFAEALNHWEASRVSAVLAVTPLGTLVIEAVVEHLFAGALPPERIDVMSLAGAGLVVAGSIATSLGGKRTVG